MRLIAQGAEAKIYEDGDTIVKERIPKGYRIPEIDSRLNKERVKREGAILKKLESCGIRAPRLIKTEGWLLYMQRIEGKTVKSLLDSTNCRELLGERGRLVAQLHAANIVHGDLTTMNFIVSAEGMHVIDFGLSYVSAKDEDKAVDLYVLERALGCGHSPDYVKYFHDAYANDANQCVRERLEMVRLRGRKREDAM